MGLFERLAISAFAAADRVWAAVKTVGGAALGSERFDRLVSGLGLREFKGRNWRSEFTARDGSRLVHRPADRCILDEIYGEDAYFRGDGPRPGEVVVDVGGHIGAFALLAARRVAPGGRVLVFEPGPDNLEFLRENLRLNPGLPVRLFECALAEAPGEADLFLADPGTGNPAANTLVDSPGRRRVRVPVRTLDEVLAAEGVGRVDHLKIDVEGAELRVLAGAAQSLGLVRRVVLEIHEPKVSTAEVEAFLTARGFQCRRLAAAGASPLLEGRRP